MGQEPDLALTVYILTSDCALLLDLQNIEALIKYATSFFPHPFELIIAYYLHYRNAAVR
jgi:hypothetical protein